MQELENKYMKEGFVADSVSAIITLFVGMVVVSIVIVFGGSLSAKAYSLQEDDIDAITNTTIKTAVQNSVLSGFEAQEQTADFVPLVAMAVVVVLVLALLLSIPGVSGRGMGGGSAL